MTREEKQKAIDVLKISAPVMVMPQEEFNDYIQTLNKVMDWLEQESILDKIRAEIACHIIEDDTSGNTPARIRADWAAANKAHLIDIAILDKYKRESEEKA